MQKGSVSSPIALSGSDDTDNAPGPFRRRVQWVTNSQIFSNISLILIISESLLAATTLFSNSCCRTYGTDIAAIVFTGILILETLLKIIADPKYHLHSKLIWIDLIIISVAVVLHCRRFGDGLYVVSFRIFNILRFFRRLKRVRTIVITILRSFGVLRDFVLVLAFIIFPFAVMATRFIGQNENFSMSETDEGTTNQKLWGNFPSSMLTLFQIATLDWGDIVRGSIHTGPWLALFYIPFIVAVGFGVCNIFIIAIGEAYEMVCINEEETESETDMNVLKKVEAEYEKSEEERSEEDRQKTHGMHGRTRTMRVLSIRSSNNANKISNVSDDRTSNVSDDRTSNVSDDRTSNVSDDRTNNASMTNSQETLDQLLNGICTPETVYEFTAATNQDIAYMIAVLSQRISRIVPV
jgi:hypothetical protein